MPLKKSYINLSATTKPNLIQQILEEGEEENEKEHTELNGDDNLDESKYTTASSATAAENDISDVSTMRANKKESNLALKFYHCNF